MNKQDMPAGIKSQLLLVLPARGLRGSSLSASLSPPHQAAGAPVQGEADRKSSGVRSLSSEAVSSGRASPGYRARFPTRSTPACSALTELRFLWTHAATRYALAYVNTHLQKPSRTKQSSKGNHRRCLNRATSCTAAAGTDWSVSGGETAARRQPAATGARGLPLERGVCRHGTAEKPLSRTKELLCQKLHHSSSILQWSPKCQLPIFAPGQSFCSTVIFLRRLVR